MLEMLPIENDLGCEAMLCRYEPRRARLILSSVCLDIDKAIDALKEFESRLQNLPFEELALSVDQSKNRVSLDGNYDQDGLFTDHFIGMRISPEGEIDACLEG